MAGFIFSLLSRAALPLAGPQQRPAPPPPEPLPFPGSPHAHVTSWRHGWDSSLCLLPLQSVGSVYSGLMQGVGAAEKVFEFIDRQPTMVHDGNLAPDHLEGRVDFENVTFTYRTRPHTKVLQVRWGLEACSDRPSPSSRVSGCCPPGCGPASRGLGASRGGPIITRRVVW